MKRTSLSLVVLGLTLGLAGCGTNAVTGKPNTLTDNLTSLRNWNSKYLPIIGKNLLLVGEIIVQAECSPLASTGSQVVSNVLNIVAPDSKSTATVTKILQTNMAVTSQVCPLVASIKATVGAVPAGTPTQTIPAVASSAS